MPPWHVYIVRCRGGELYTGISNDVERRFAEHRAGRGARYLRGRGPLRLVLDVEIGSLGRALRVEHRIKQLDRGHKEALIAQPELAARMVSD